MSSYRTGSRPQSSRGLPATALRPIERPEDDDHDRLAALQESAERNRAQPINDENFEKFFGYPGKARRNTSWQ